jgi:1,4-alpha-glucan branching enzyme
MSVSERSYRNLVLYEVSVRNHSVRGTFAGVEADLPRVAGMGVDCIWLMPIHPIG